PVVVSDANAEINRPIYAKVVGYDPPHYSFPAADGAPIQRTLLRCASATRRTWLPRGKLNIGPSLVAAVRSLFEWAAEDPATKSLGLISMQVLELALRAARDPTGTAIDDKWRKAGQSEDTLKEAREKLGPIVQAWP